MRVGHMDAGDLDLMTERECADDLADPDFTEPDEWAQPCDPVLAARVMRGRLLRERWAALQARKLLGVTP